MAKVRSEVKLPVGYHLDWAGEYESQKRSQRRLLIVLPITILVIYVILFTMFQSSKWAALTLANVSMAPIAARKAAQIGRNTAGAVAVELMAAAEGWPETPWLKPWKKEN